MSESEQTIRRYLLGELPETEQSALEEKYFTDPQIFNEVLETESELVDDYVRGQLASEVRERFEQSYMAHPARSERVKFAAALATRLDQKKEPVTREQLTLAVSWWQRLLALLSGQRLTLRFSVALATLLIMLGGVWLFVESRRRQQSELARTQAAREAQEQRERAQLAQPTPDEAKRAERTPQQIRQPTPTPTLDSAPHSVSLALIVSGVRGGDSNQIPTLVIPPGTTQARLLLNLKESNYPSYRASLQTITGVEIFSQTNVKPGSKKTGASFVFTVPAHKFANGDYVLTLRGINPDGEVDDLSKSLFRVEKK
jgi:type II secretory pathway pseudopilin PulG